MQEQMTGQEIAENTLVNRWVNEYMKEKEKREQLEKDYKLLEEKYEQALNDYDELLQSHPDCKNCEDDLMLKLSSSEIECDRLRWFYDKLNKALDIKDELNKALREENEELRKELQESTVKNRNLKQECEELTKNNDEPRMRLCNECGEKDDYNIPCKMIRDLDYDLQKALEENERYRKALVEIEELANENNELLQGYHHEWANNKLILEIINKAKG